MKMGRRKIDTDWGLKESVTAPTTTQSTRAQEKERKKMSKIQ